MKIHNEKILFCMLKVHDDKYMICEGVHMDWFSIDEHTMFDQLGVIIFGSVRFLSKKSNQTKKKKF